MRTSVLPILFLAAASSVAAHHSLTDYELAREAMITVVVREFHFVNPHPYLLADGSSSAESRMWRLELDNRWELSEIGMGADTFARGDRLLVSGAPGRDGKATLYVRALERPEDGFKYEQRGSSPRIVSPGRGKPR